MGNERGNGGVVLSRAAVGQGSYDMAAQGAALDKIGVLHVPLLPSSAARAGRSAAKRAANGSGCLSLGAQVNGQISREERSGRTN
jgi:hypothetical protein